MTAADDLWARARAILAELPDRIARECRVGPGVLDTIRELVTRLASPPAGPPLGGWALYGLPVREDDTFEPGEWRVLDQFGDVLGAGHLPVFAPRPATGVYPVPWVARLSDARGRDRRCDIGGDGIEDSSGHTFTVPRCLTPPTHRYRTSFMADGWWMYRCAEHTGWLHAPGLVVEPLAPPPAGPACTHCGHHEPQDLRTKDDGGLICRDAAECSGRYSNRGRRSL